MENFNLPHGGCNHEECKECFQPERLRMDKITELRRIIARMQQMHGIATNPKGYHSRVTNLDAVQYFSLGDYAKDSWRLQELVSDLDKAGYLGWNDGGISSEFYSN